MSCSNSGCVHQPPIWPGNSPNEFLYSHQNLFNRDAHNHSEVIGEQTYGLPLMVPGNAGKSFEFVNQYTGQVQTAPFSTDNTMHTNWVPYRLGTNLNTHFGSDSAIYFNNTITPKGEAFYEGTPAEVGYRKWQDWLDNPVSGEGSTADNRVAATCEKGLVCAQTCTDWWTGRSEPPQGSLMTPGLPVSGGCPFGTTQALACYPCGSHDTYVRGSK